MERRTAPRANIDILVNAFENGLPTVGLAQNLSSTGMRFRKLQGARGMDAKIYEVEFVLPGRNEVIVAEGRVCSNDGRTVGLKFDRISEDARKWIASYVGVAA